VVVSKHTTASFINSGDMPLKVDYEDVIYADEIAPYVPYLPEGVYFWATRGREAVARMHYLPGIVWFEKMREHFGCQLDSPIEYRIWHLARGARFLCSFCRITGKSRRMYSWEDRAQFDGQR